MYVLQVKTKTVAQCVEFYYLSKKLEDKRKTRKEEECKVEEVEQQKNVRKTKVHFKNWMCFKRKEYACCLKESGDCEVLVRFVMSWINYRVIQRGMHKSSQPSDFYNWSCFVGDAHPSASKTDASRGGGPYALTGQLLPL